MCVCVCNTMEIVFYNAMLSPKKMLKQNTKRLGQLSWLGYVHLSI